MINVLLNEAGEFLIPLNGLPDRRNLIAGDVPGDVFAVLAGLMVVEGSFGTLAEDGKAARSKRGI